MDEQNRGERRRLEAERQKFDAAMAQIATYAEARAGAFGLELDRGAFIQSDDLGIAVVLNFYSKDAKICGAAKIDLLIERLDAVIDGQPEIADGDEPAPA